MLRNLRDETVTIPNIFKRPGPTAACVADAPVLKIPCGHALCCQGGTKMSRMGEVILVSPISAMNIHDDEIWPFALRQAQIAELIRIASISNTNVSRRWRKGQNFIGKHAAGIIGLLVETRLAAATSGDLLGAIGDLGGEFHAKQRREYPCNPTSL